MPHTSQQKREIRAKRKAAGLCNRCGKRESAVGSTRCSLCLDYARYNSDRVYQARKAEGLCPRCGGPRDDGADTYCVNCSLETGRLCSIRRSL